jgi:hypothetical protein
MLSRNLEKSLHRALAHANDRRHEYATLEHLLLALTEDQDAIAVLRGCSVDVDGLRLELLSYVDNELANLVTGYRGDAKPMAGFQRVLQGASIHVQSSALDEVTGANVLVPMFDERESHAVFFLQRQNITQLDLVNYISHGNRKALGRYGLSERLSGGGSSESILGRDWSTRRGPTVAPHRLPGAQIWGMSVPVQHVKGRLAFVKAELEISDAQDQLWDVFAEALRDFLQARSRPRSADPAGASGLPERLAMREQDLASELESLRQWKAIVETFYAGLSTVQRRHADQLLTQLFGF